MARLTPEEEKGLKEAYAKVYEQKNLQEFQTRGTSSSSQARQQRIDALRSQAKPFMNQGKVTVSSNNPTGTPQKIGSTAGSTGGSTGGSVKVDGKALMNKLRAGSSGGSVAGAAGSSGGSVAGAAGQAAPAKKPGLLGRLGSLAGKAVSGARNVAGNVAGAARNVAGNVASGIKAGAKAVGSALANKGPVQGSRSRFNNRGGSAGAAPAPATGAAPQQAQPVQKMGSIEKSNRSIHGDAKIDALKSKNAQFQAAKKSGNLAQYRKDNPKLSGAERAKAMARARIAAKNAPITASYDPIFDETVHFLVSEGHVKDEAEAISIMSEPEFIESFNEELYG